ncbi:MAG: sulfate ABC transporter ATP-binding protein [Phycisphaeraceae bacterium]|nr:sulfate ABC transporter ATP-binding protein [Phycisphaeraceae bacterium]
MEDRTRSGDRHRRRSRRLNPMSIQVRNISKTFGSFKALEDVSLQVNSGELIALLGPSGSGKTTLLRIIAGLEQADPGGGGIRFHDEDVGQRHVSARGVGFVFQHYALFRHMSVFENIAFGLRVKPRRHRPSRAAIREKVLALLALVQLDGLARRYPHQLSGGQRQRVALARALAVEPKVLLLDEPFGALDAKVRQELRAWLRRLHDELHITSVFVTHDQDEALEVADRVVVMNRGRIEQAGTPDEVFHHPGNEFVLKFLGQVNRFHGRIEQGRPVVGTLALDAQAMENRREGEPVEIFVRPFDFELIGAGDQRPSLPARIQRVQSAGPVVRLELTGPSNEPVRVELPHPEAERLDLTVGREVRLALRRSRVFTEDYSI